MNILGLNVCHPLNPIGGFGGSPLGESQSSDPPLS